MSVPSRFSNATLAINGNLGRVQRNSPAVERYPFLGFVETTAQEKWR
jgi:hypothetical protein